MTKKKISKKIAKIGELKITTFEGHYVVYIENSCNIDLHFVCVCRH